MKKIIATALSLIVGVFGYTIADKELSTRVDDLEASVSSMQEEISSLHDTKPTTIPETITYTNVIANTTTSTTHSIPKIGSDILPFGGSFKSKFMLRCYSDGGISYIPTGDSPLPGYTTTTITNVHKETTTQLTYTDVLLCLTNVEAIVSVSESFTEPYSYYDEDYSVVYSYQDKQNNEVTFKFKGNTSPELSGKLVNFDLQFWHDYYHDITPSNITITTDNTIDTSGNFEYTVVYKFSENISGFFLDDSVNNGCIKYVIDGLTVK